MVTLFASRGPEVVAVAEFADALRQQVVGDDVTFCNPYENRSPDRRRLDFSAELRIAASPHTQILFKRDPRRGIRILDREQRGYRFRAQGNRLASFMAKSFGAH